MSQKFSSHFITYKARNSGDGAASQWDLSADKGCVFLEMAHQQGKDEKGNASFDWPNKICFKLGLPDIGEILAVLCGVQKGVGPLDTERGKHKGLFHSNNTGNAILNFGKDDKGTFHIRLSVKKDEGQTVVQHTLTKGEVCVLGILLRRAVEAICRW